MPGYELIGDEEKNELNSIFDNGGGVLFRHSFEKFRNNSYKVKEFEFEFGEFIGNKKTLAVSSGTAALRVAIASLGIPKDSEIITQCFTFVATAEAIVESGCRPVFTEIDQTLNMDPSDLEKRITPNTKAVIVVHMLGTPARLGEIYEICKKNNLYLIEDTAWGCGGEYKHIKLGNFGDVGCFSFDFAKTITTGEGGMLVFRDDKHFKNGVAFHDHGHENNPNFPRWEDTRVSSGFNYRMSELSGAIGKSQLKKLNYVINSHRKNANSLREIFRNFPMFTERDCPPESQGTDDAFIFFSKTISPSIIRKELLKNEITTKILPEATTWHFAAHWEHIIKTDIITGLPISKAFPKSTKLLRSAVSLPIGVKINDDFKYKILQTIELLTTFNQK